MMYHGKWSGCKPHIIFRNGLWMVRWRHPDNPVVLPPAEVHFMTKNSAASRAAKEFVASLNARLVANGASKLLADQIARRRGRR